MLAVLCALSYAPCPSGSISSRFYRSSRARCSRTASRPADPGVRQQTVRHRLPSTASICRSPLPAPDGARSPASDEPRRLNEIDPMAVCRDLARQGAHDATP